MTQPGTVALVRVTPDLLRTDVDLLTHEASLQGLPLRQLARIVLEAYAASVRQKDQQEPRA